MWAKVKKFAMRNLTWISTIGTAVLKRCKLCPEDYIKNLVNGTIPFDELAIVIMCRVYNIHCIVLLNEGYWTTRPNSMFHDCLLWLAYVGNFGFKEISTELIEQLSEPEPDSDSLDQDVSDSLDQDVSAEQEDLAGTGLLDEENYEQSDTNSNNAVPAKESNEHDTNNDNSVDIKPPVLAKFHFASDTIVIDPDDNDNSVDIKPPVLAKFHFASDTIVIDPDDNDNSVDIKPPVLAKFCFASDTIVIDSDSDTEDVVHDKNAHDDDATDVIFERYYPPKYGQTQCQRKYDCYVCNETFEMQQSFVVHFQSKHPKFPFKCAFCSGDFQSNNSLFKHERWHEYMKYLCIVCSKRFQFPYQLTTHQTVHTGLHRHKCNSCDKTFGSKCSRDFHQKTHGVELHCDLCPKTSEKTFSNDVALKQHQRGIHGPGWTTPCGAYKKWKSACGKHLKECKKCMKI